MDPAKTNPLAYVQVGRQQDAAEISRAMVRHFPQHPSAVSFRRPSGINSSELGAFNLLMMRPPNRVASMKTNVIKSGW